MAILQELPEDLLIDILCRLPLESLLRSRSVCKYLYFLLRTPGFIYLHHHRTASAAADLNTDRLLVQRFLDRGEGDAVLSFVLDQTPVEDIDMSSTGLDLKNLSIWGPCNGVVCLTRYALNSTIVIWNPSMKEFRVLPQPSYKSDHLSNLGFGYDPYTDDYKVVRFGMMSMDLPFKKPRERTDEAIEIYELRTDSWREVDAVAPIKSGLHCFYDSYALWNGDCFWYACPQIGYPQTGPVIMAFSMSDEVFEMMPLPEVCLLDKHSEQKLLVLNDSLSIVIYPNWWSNPSWFPPESEYAKSKSFDIWVMNAEGVEVSWTKKCTVGPFPGLDWALGFRQNGEFLLESGSGQMMSYNLDTGERKEYEVYDQNHGHPKTPNLQVIPYTQSLVSVKRQQ